MVPLPSGEPVSFSQSHSGKALEIKPLFLFREEEQLASCANLKKDLADCSVNQFPGSVLPSLQLSRALSTPMPESGAENKLVVS